MIWLLTTIRTALLEDAKRGDRFSLLLKVPVIKSPMGLLMMPDPVQAEEVLEELGEIATSRNTNPHVIFITWILIQVKAANGSAAAADSDGRRVGGSGGESDVGSAAAPNSGSHRSDVFGVGTGSKGESEMVWLSGLFALKRLPPTSQEFRAL